MTLGLALIMKDEIKDLDRIIKNYGNFFDKIYVTVTDKKTYITLSKRFPTISTNNILVELSYFKWIDHFGKARNYNLSQVKTDYWMWIDLDDQIINSELLPGLLEQIISDNVDAVNLAYEYSFDQYGNCVQVFWRPRILRKSKDFEWRNSAVHETISLPERSRRVNSEKISIRHLKLAQDIAASTLKYREMVIKQWQLNPQPQIALYVGNAYVIEQKFAEALEVFTYITEQGNRDQKIEAYLSIAQIYFYRRSYKAALEAVNHAFVIYKNYVEALYLKVLIYMALGEYEKAKKEADILLSLPDPVDGSISYDPSKLTYKGYFLAARAHLYSGSVARAYELFKRAQQLSPDYIKTESNEYDWTEVFESVHKNPKIITNILPLTSKHNS
jgi:tetratricopeptide (TPR) repeat protein